MADKTRHHGPFVTLSQTEETQHSDNHDHEPNDIDYVVHVQPPCDGNMPARQASNPSTRVTVASKTGVVRIGREPLVDLIRRVVPPDYIHHPLFWWADSPDPKDASVGIGRLAPRFAQ